MKIKEYLRVFFFLSIFNKKSLQKEREYSNISKQSTREDMENEKRIKNIQKVVDKGKNL